MKKYKVILDKLLSDREISQEAYEEALNNPDRAGEIVWDNCKDRRETAVFCGHWLGWPKCGCTGCGCEEPAETTDAAGIPVCIECKNFVTDDDGQVHCSKCSDTEIVSESCGAGNQSRSYVRIKPPEMPEEDPDGEYALYWETVGNDAHVAARFTTKEQAEQAVKAKDWPPANDTTQYMCGWGVRQLVNGEWVQCGD